MLFLSYTGPAWVGCAQISSRGSALPFPLHHSYPRKNLIGLLVSLMVLIRVRCQISRSDLVDEAVFT